MKRLLLLLRNALCLTLLASLLVSCGSNPKTGVDVFNRDGHYYKRNLKAAIANADSIKIEEHSHQTDFHGTIKDINKAPRYRYAKKTLSGFQKQQLAQDINRMSSRTRTLFTRCTFVPHHTFYFYEQGKLSSKLEICYQCGDVKWNGTKRTMPADLISALTPTVKRVGLKPSRNWKKLAAATYQSKQPTKPVNPPPSILRLKIPKAEPVPGRPGFYFNPYTQNMVDCEGIPSGTKIRDPQDPNIKHVFIVP